MVQFKNSIESHNHSLQTLSELYNYDSFLDSLETIADFGCGEGLDTKWWATLLTRDEPPEPRNYKVFGVDKNIKQVDNNVSNLSNVHLFDYDLDDYYFQLPKLVDLVWCHNTFQFLLNPITALRAWNKSMNVNGMLIIILPQSQHTYNNKIQARGYHNIYYNYNVINLMYMLAVNGFDCRDAYFLKNENSPWLHAAVYKSDIEPMDPRTTNWYHLAETNLLNDSVVNSINKYGYVRQEDIFTTWIDKDFHFPTE